MELEKLPYRLTVCKVTSMDDIDLHDEILFIGKTDEELSLVCATEKTPAKTVEREDGWRGFRIRGTLDFSLIGVLSNFFYHERIKRSARVYAAVKYPACPAASIRMYVYPVREFEYVVPFPPTSELQL